MPKNIPNVENEISSSAKEMAIPNQMDNIDYGKKVPVRNRKVVIRDTKTNVIYGSRAIATKESASVPSFKEWLMEASPDNTELPGILLDEIRKNIRTGAKDLAQKWASALELTNKAFAVARTRLPPPSRKGAWRQYTDLIAYAVGQLSAVRGRDGDWRLTAAIVKEAFAEDIDSKAERFFVSVPGEETAEVDCQSMDELIDDLVSKGRRRGATIRVLSRDAHGAELGVWVRDVKQDHIVIQAV